MNTKVHSVQMIVFDWAGTTVDFGSRAPLQIFEKTFQHFGLEFTLEEIAGPMGMEKKDHIRTLLSTEEGTTFWKNTQNRDWDENDVERIYDLFEANLKMVVQDYSHVIEGVPEAVQKLRESGVKIGSTTGYSSEIMKPILEQARWEGYEVDCCVTPDVCGFSRPKPFMVFECMKRLQVYPPKNVIKVGDTLVDIAEGKNAGAWSVGVLTGSSVLGFSKEQYDKLSSGERWYAKQVAQQKFFEAGADFVIDSIADLPELVKKIDEKLR